MAMAKALLIGNVGRDPEQRYTQTGTMTVSFSMAVNNRRRNPDGSYQDETEWYRITAAGRLAEICQQYVNKGSQLYVEDDCGLIAGPARMVRPAPRSTSSPMTSNYSARASSAKASSPVQPAPALAPAPRQAAARRPRWTAATLKTCPSRRPDAAMNRRHPT